MTDLNITEEELNALKTYINEDYEAMNQMLISDSETDIALLSEDVENKVVRISYLRNSIVDYIKNIKLVYKLILKQFYNEERKNKNVVFYRGTNLAEIERIKNELFIDRFLVATENQNDAIDKYASNWNRPACMNIALKKDVPHIFIKDVLNNDSDAILISPFTRIETIIEGREVVSNTNSKTVKTYDVRLQKQELDELEQKDRIGLYNYILDNSYSIKRKIEECIELEKENTFNFEKIRKFEQLLNKLENGEDTIDDFSENNISELKDIDRISDELEDLKMQSNELFNIRKQNIEFVNSWKRNIAVYLIAECREIEKKFDILRNQLLEQIEIEEKEEQERENKEKEEREKQEEIKQEELKQEENEKQENNILETNINVDLEKEKDNVEEFKESDDSLEEKTNLENSTITAIATDEKEDNSETSIEPKEESQEQNEELEIKNEDDEEKEELIEKEKTLEEEISEELEGEDEESITYASKNGCKENIIEIKKLLNNINNLITKQQNHAKLAGSIGASYSALNNAFEMRKSAEKLLEIEENTTLETRAICEKEQNKETIDDLNKIIRNNFEVSTLLNYLNNPKIASRNSKLDRFAEMEVIEENELKRCIAEKIRDIRGEAELKKLKDDLEYIEEKGKFSNFLGFFTGQNKLDNVRLEQIEVRQTAIRKTLSKKLTLAHNYSIHELMAEVQMFIEENEDDELIAEDVKALKEISEQLRKNYIILESKVRSIIDEKEGRNLPVRDKKISKKELLEIETYRFLNKYGYDLNSFYNEEEPKYQDTMANEINRIVEYLDSENIDE